MRSLFKPIAITVTAIFIFGCADNDVRMVKDAYLNIDSSVTVGDALDNKEICETTNWHSYEDDRGRVFVRHECHFKGFKENIHKLLTSRIDHADSWGEEISSGTISEINKTIDWHNERLEQYRKNINSIDVYDAEQELYTSTGSSERRRVYLIASIDRYQDRDDSLEEKISNLNKKEYEEIPSESLKFAFELLDRHDPNIHYPLPEPYVGEDGIKVVPSFDENIDESLYEDFMKLIRETENSEMLRKYRYDRDKFFEEAPSNIEDSIEYIRLSLIEEYKNERSKIKEIMNEYDKISDLIGDEIKEYERRIENYKRNIEKEKNKIPEIKRRRAEANEERRNKADKAIDFYKYRMENTDSFYEYFDFRIDKASDSFTVTSGGVLVKAGDDVVGRSTYGGQLNQRVKRAYEYSGDDIDEYLDQFFGNFYPSNFAPPLHKLIN